MREVTTKRHIYVSLDGDAAPYVIVPREQAEQVRRLFTKHDVAYTGAERGQQDYAVFDLGQDADVGRVQAVLDSVR